MLPELSAAAWVLLVAAAAVVGVSKTALPGASTLSVAAFAAVLPARQSTGALLALLVVGDVFALWSYHRHADWKALVRLAPAVLAGVLLGVGFLALADDSEVRRVIGVTLLVLIAFTLWRRRRASEGPPPGGRVLYGTLGGFTTMVANAGGPVMSMYFLAARFPVKTFLGTAAWFFATVNIVKLPFSISLGLLTPAGALLDLVLVPAVLVGALAGRRLADRFDQAAFERVVVVLTVVGAVYLLL
ncbi:sulfite exporter TauE/SafE family protein [Demequina capsici]|uniref:Probable membrane transporter protein n=1 Tax=Demequina capsici TaxID=3075620 RepID=A0AA96FC57_9MICO|nr:sulfite exporter TauE/SafE family protein [Demequina sp. PMTSA13]WNM27438.1 sulfite exporter TauE/SafE family protein [Demequina sp. PMTSA13]